MRQKPSGGGRIKGGVTASRKCSRLGLMAFRLESGMRSSEKRSNGLCRPMRTPEHWGEDMNRELSIGKLECSIYVPERRGRQRGN